MSLEQIFNNLLVLRQTSFAYAIRDFLIVVLKDKAKDFWINWMSINNSNRSIYKQSWNNKLEIRQKLPSYTIEILKEIEEFFLETDNFEFTTLVSNIKDEIIYLDGKFYFWDKDDLSWITFDKNDKEIIIKFIKNKISHFFIYLKFTYENLKFYFCIEDNDEFDHKFKKKNIIFIIFEKLKRYLNSIDLLKVNSIEYFNNLEKNKILFENKKVLDLKTKIFLNNQKNFYFKDFVKTRNIIENNKENCLTKLLNQNLLFELQIILGTLLSNENNNNFYFIYSQNFDVTTYFLNIFQTLLGSFFINPKDTLFTEDNTQDLENIYDLKNKKLIVLNSYGTTNFDINKLIKLKQKYKYLKFVIALNKIPVIDFSDNQIYENLIIIKLINDHTVLQDLNNDEYDKIFSWLLDGVSCYLESQKNLFELCKKYFDYIKIQFMPVTIKTFFDENIITDTKKHIFINTLYCRYLKFIKINNGQLMDKIKFIEYLRYNFELERLNDGLICKNIMLKN